MIPNPQIENLGIFSIIKRKTFYRPPFKISLQLHLKLKNALKNNRP